MAFPTNANQVQAFAGAMYGQQVGSTTMGQVTSDIQASGGLANALNAYYSASFGARTTASVGTSVAANLGLTGSAATVAADYITAQLNAAPASARGSVIANILNLFSGLTADATFGTAATAWNTKVDVAAAYKGASDVAIGTVISTPFNLVTGTDTYVGTDTADSISGVLSYTAAGLQAPQTGSTFTLTDTISAGAGIDTLNLTIDGVLDGGATGGGDPVNLPASTVTGIEVLVIRDVATSTAAADILTFAGTNFPGLTTLTNDRSSGAIAVTALPAGTVINLETVSGATAAGYAAAATTATVNAKAGVTGGLVALTGAGVTSTTVTSTGAANTLGGLTIPATSTSLAVNATTGLATGTITGAGLKTITVTGAAATGTTQAAAASANGAVKLGTAPATVTAIDASGLTAGGVEATLVAAVTSFKGGAGNDHITTAVLTDSSTPSIIDGGAGTDTLVLGAYATVNSATLAKQYANFEIVDSGALTGTAVDMALFTNSTITGIATGGATAPSFSNVNAAQAANVTIYGNQATTTTIAVKDAAVNGNLDTLTLKFNDGLSATSTYTLASLVAAGVETLNVVATDNAAISLLTSSTALTAINVSGAGTTSITTGAVAVNPNTTVDASTATGAFTFVGTGATANGYKILGSATKANTITTADLADIITGGAGVDTIVAGAGNDTISTGAGDDIITGGGGVDTINVGSGIDTVIQLSAAADTLEGVLATGADLTNADKITGMGNGDKIDLAGNFTLTLANGAVTVGTTFATATANLVTIVSGSYNETTKIFTSGAASATNNDYLLQYNGGTSATTVNSTLLIDIVGTVTATSASEVITLTVS